MYNSYLVIYVYVRDIEAAQLVVLIYFTYYHQKKPNKNGSALLAAYLKTHNNNITHMTVSSLYKQPHRPHKLHS